MAELSRRQMLGIGGMGGMSVAMHALTSDSRARFVEKYRDANVIVNTANVFAAIDATLAIQIPAKVGDIIECSFSAMWGKERVFSQIEFCTLNGAGGGVVTQFAGGRGVGGLTGVNGARSIYARRQQRLKRADIINGVVHLSPWARTNSAHDRTLFAPIMFGAENKGPGTTRG